MLVILKKPFYSSFSKTFIQEFFYGFSFRGLMNLTAPTWVPIWGPGSPWGPFSDFGSPLGPHLFFKVPIFSILSLRAREKSVQPPSNDDHLIIQNKWHKHCALNDDTLCLCEYLKETLYFNKLARFGQFFKKTLFGSPFLLSRVPIWSPFHSKLGPH